jgi:hypothetical protein
MSDKKDRLSIRVFIPDDAPLDRREFLLAEARRKLGENIVDAIGTVGKTWTRPQIIEIVETSRPAECFGAPGCEVRFVVWLGNVNLEEAK